MDSNTYAGGVGLYINNFNSSSALHGIDINIDLVENLWVKIESSCRASLRWPQHIIILHIFY